MEKESFLTTSDNPYDPFTHFDQWYTYDHDKGYFTCELVSRLALTSDSLSDEYNNQIIEETYDEIIRLFPNVLGFENVSYKKVFKDTKN